MKRYKVNVEFDKPSTGFTIIKADSQEEAEDLAMQMDVTEFDWTEDESDYTVTSIEEIDEKEL